MAKKKHKQNWQRNIKINPEDNCILNTKHWFEPDDFETDLPTDVVEVFCDYLNRLRIEYITLRWNGMPLKSYKPEVAEKIQEKKDMKLARKLEKAEILLRYTEMKLKDDFDPTDVNNKPKKRISDTYMAGLAEGLKLSRQLALMTYNELEEAEIPQNWWDYDFYDMKEKYDRWFLRKG